MDRQRRDCAFPLDFLALASAFAVFFRDIERLALPDFFKESTYLLFFFFAFFFTVLFLPFFFTFFPFFFATKQTTSTFHN
ncbi:hypothetical protein COU37_01970 [Candidatus Micrarchaeota archaeon CG10_big_fil_rev_8_21_14_0_10_45_29]|nr:MAG: hypothetical protein COU37_01970 [Candidatus Micrarchaeota archaeon CG10_big_fil_rev_8_21_14_0_10_45_29]